jgi:hypothetical protein
VSNVPAKTPPSLDDVVLDFTLRLHELVELATRKRGEELISSIFSAVRAGPASRLAKREMRQADRERRRLLASLTGQFLRAIEQATRSRVRAALDREWAARARARAQSSIPEGMTTPATAPARRRGRRRPLPPPPDPEQLKRDAEFARLRALLRPAAEELPPPVPPPVTAAPVVQTPRPATPGEFLRALENEIQNVVPTLGALGPERCGAQIAAWAGQVRELRDRLPPELSAAMRPAIRIFLEHLTELRAAMDAHFVDALEPKWNAPDWGDYIEVNRARAEGRPPALSTDKLETYHRAMLRALVQPHRRNVPAQAIPVITAAAEFLPADDGQLRSAIRRHSSEWQAKAGPDAESPQGLPVTGEPPMNEPPLVEPPAEAPPAPEPRAEEPLVEPTTEAAEPVVAFPEPDAAESPPAAPQSTTPPTGGTDESEFDQPWTK